jgi:hypothetical protein
MIVQINTWVKGNAEFKEEYKNKNVVVEVKPMVEGYHCSFTINSVIVCELDISAAAFFTLFVRQSFDDYEQHLKLVAQASIHK